MKNLLITLLLVTVGATAQNYNSNWSKQDKQYYKIIGFGVDTRNALVGSNPTNNEAELNYQVKLGARANNVEIFLQYEQFNRINYQSYGLNVGYITQLSGKFDGYVGIESGSIIRQGNSNFLYVGGNLILRYNISKLLAVELQSNTRLRNDVEGATKTNKIYRTSGFVNLIVKL